MAGTKFWKQTGGSLNELAARGSVQEDARRDLTERILAPCRMGIQPTVDGLLVDVSGSTGDVVAPGDPNRLRKIDAEKAAAAAFIMNHPTESLMALATFADRADLVIPLSDVSADRMRFINEMYGCLTPGGHTNLAQGLELLLAELSKAGEGRKRRGFVITDALPTDNPLPVAEEMKRQGVEITTIGFGIRAQEATATDAVNLDEDLLKQIASTGADGQPLYKHFTDMKNITRFMIASSRIMA